MPTGYLNVTRSRISAIAAEGAWRGILRPVEVVQGPYEKIDRKAQQVLGGHGEKKEGLRSELGVEQQVQAEQGADDEDRSRGRFGEHSCQPDNGQHRVQEYFYRQGPEGAVNRDRDGIVVKDAGQVVIDGVEENVLEVIQRQRVVHIARERSSGDERPDDEGREQGSAEQGREYPEKAFEEKRTRARIRPSSW